MPARTHVQPHDCLIECRLRELIDLEADQSWLINTTTKQNRTETEDRQKQGLQVAVRVRNSLPVVECRGPAE